MSKMGSGSQTRSSLLLRIRDAGDQVAWGEFVEIYTPLIYGYCRRRGLQEADAADVAQEVMQAVARAIGQFEYRPERGRFRHWLGTITRHEIGRFLKRAKGPVAAGVGGEESDVLARTEARGEASAWEEQFNAYVVEVALARIRPHFETPTWRAFEMVWLRDLPAEQAARQLQHDVQWVYRCLYRVVKRLEQEVQELAEDSVLAAL